MHQVAQHSKRNFARIRPVILVKSVLRSQPEFTPVYLYAQRLQYQHAWRQYNFDAALNARTFVQAVH
jgi:hypothetical protein